MIACEFCRIPRYEGEKKCCQILYSRVSLGFVCAFAWRLLSERILGEAVP